LLLSNVNGIDCDEKKNGKTFVLPNETILLKVGTTNFLVTQPMKWREKSLANCLSRMGGTKQKLNKQLYSCFFYFVLPPKKHLKVCIPLIFH
jgi:hypothetical protein